jgi:AcrR family transcriptional regulator
VPKVWADTIDEHKTAVRQAVIQATASLIGEHGFSALTMSAVAERAGIGRATLYKYFSGPDEVLISWHEDSVARHVAALRAACDEQDPWRRLRCVLETYAELSREHPGGEFVPELHRSHHVKRAELAVEALVADAIASCARVDLVRTDVSADELASFCTSALGGARRAPTKASRARLISVTLDALRPVPR